EGAGRSEAHRIRRGRGRDGGRRDAEPVEGAPLAPCVARYYIVALEQLDLVRGQQWLGQELEEEGLHRSDREWDRQQQAPSPDRSQQVLHQLLEASHRRPTELVGRPQPAAALDSRHDGLRYVADKHWLKPRLAATDERQHRRQLRERGKPVEELILGTKHE